MIHNSRQAVRVFGIALLIAATGHAYAQLSRELDAQALPEWSDACVGAGVASTPARCGAGANPSGSKYNLLYADDAPDGEAATLPAHRSRHAREDASQDAPRNEAAGR
jgi:hypothetical protein